MPIDPRLSYYKISLYDHTGTRILLLTRYEYLSFSQRLNDSHNHQIRIEYAPDDPDLTFFREELERDWILQIQRTDPFTGVRSIVYEGFHRTLVDQIKLNGVVVLTLYGTGYTQLLKRRIVIPPEGEEASTISGAAESVMRQYVADQAVSPVDASRTIQDLSLNPSSALGNTASYSARYTNLYTVVKRLSEQGEVDFGILRPAGLGTFVFTVRSLWGEDRRTGNTAGNPPTIFDTDLNNMLIPIFSKRGTDEVNHVYIGGQGQGVDRVIIEEENAVAKAVSPWNRHEAFVDARNEATDEGLTTRGQAYLEEHRASEELTFNIENTEGTRWIRDWGLGDLVTAKYAGRTFDKRIVEVDVVLSAGETGSSVIEVISAELEDVD